MHTFFYLVQSFFKSTLFFVSMLVMTLSFTHTAMAAPEVVPNKPIDAVQAKQLKKADAKSSIGELTLVNKELSTKNASLQQENNALQTQLNVLTAERSNQVFMTGAFVAMGGIFLGFIAAWLLIGRRGSDW